MVYPHMVWAAGNQTSSQSANIFEIKITDSNLVNKISNPNQTLTIGEIQATDPLVVNLQAYLQKNKSPLQAYTTQLLQHENWKTVLSISFVESHMCIHNLNYNCSGIGGPGHFYAFDDFGGWIDCMSNLLNKRYYGQTFDQMNGVYVQPKSVNWALGSKKIYNELVTLERISDEQRVAMAQNTIKQNQELATIAQ